MRPLILLLLSIWPLLAWAQSINVRGTALSDSGAPLPGVNVTVAGTTLGSFTDAAGAFQLEVPPAYDTLIFSYTGYEIRRIPIRRNAPMQVVLKPISYELNEVTVIGFGEQNKKTLTGAFSSTCEEAFQNVSVSNWEQALQGRLPGVSITSASGGLDASASIRVRGVGSISAGNQPLIVIDGTVLSGLGGIESLGYLTNPFIGLNTEDIASVEVLKDAAAAGIYGSRGSNGVILITTKSGRYEAKPTVTLNYYAGFSEISERYDLLNGKEYAALWNEAARNVGNTANLYDVTAQPTTDWQSLLLRRGFVQQAQASISGGTANTRFYISGTFRDENGNLITTNFKRYSVRANFEQRIGDKWSAGLSVAPTRVADQRVGNQLGGSPFGWAAWYFPNVEAFHPDGQPIRTPLVTSNGAGGFTGNPLLTAIDQEAEVVTQHLLARGHLQFSPLPGLRLRTEASTEASQENEWKYAGPATFFGRGVGSGSVQQQHIASFQWTNQADWSPLLPAGHRLDLTAGMQLVRTSFEGDYTAGSNFSSDQVRYLNSTAQVEEFFSWHTASAFLGYFSRLHYCWLGRYLLELSGRYDGSSRFGAGRRFGFFPAASAGWILTEEPFLKSAFLDFLKIRTSYGLTGNAEIGDFASRGLVAANNNYLGQPGYLIQSLENRNLGWEKCRQWNAGLDFALWDNRIRGTVDYYIKDTRDLLLEVPAPATNGVSTILENAGAVRNSGLEFELSVDVLRGPLRWTVQLNGATLRNQVLELAGRDGNGEEGDIILNGRNLFRSGEPVGAFYLVKYAGVDPENGDALFYDLEGNKVANHAPAENRQIVGSPIPRFSGGMVQSLQFRGFELSAFFHFKTGHQIYLLHSSLENNMTWGDNQLRTQLDAWRPDNRDTDVPQARLWAPNGNQPSTRYLHDADFVRLKNLTLAYTFPAIGKQAAQLRLFASAQNLFTLTRFPGLDPDSEFYPAQQAAQGGVLYNLPASSTYTVGVNLKL
ncbi:MAG: TonB-dependent receptor [Phaeodactylibacter sp.]|nr:TonB-dependent receptor [Phaeodactylibacter sp.]MCB0638110.1 TonB-dependent receptor [Lewinella sp.]MCB9304047.1 TonB-dependent receptor [Lewinellaceae bacterium]